MYFVYYDNPLNYNLNTNKRSNKRLKIEVNNMPVVNKAVIGLATVDYEGYLTREVLQKSNKELKVKKGAPVFIPKLTSNMDDKLLVRAFYRKKYKLGFLLFDSNSKKSEEWRNWYPKTNLYLLIPIHSFSIADFTPIGIALGY